MLLQGFIGKNAKIRIFRSVWLHSVSSLWVMWHLDSVLERSVVGGSLSSVSVHASCPLFVSGGGWWWSVLAGGSSYSAGWVGGFCVREMSGVGVGIEYLLWHAKIQYFTLLHEFWWILVESHRMLEFHSYSAGMVGISNSCGFRWIPSGIWMEFLWIPSGI